ncbi:DUF4870 domain-containing protein [Paenibacillus yanchengensis]|uniref:DUF4870 domain-containing protein n=1 Tax=Paenibacillus yanchengensis TaxID=2035833 RepID=A0ABW4YNX1_9BACL
MNIVNLDPDPSSTHLEPKVAGLLCYALIFVTGFIFLIVEKKSRFVKFHALQSIIIFGALTLLNIILPIIPIIGFLFSFLLSPIIFVLWLAFMLLALQGRTITIPYISKFIYDQLDRF